MRGGEIGYATRVVFADEVSAFDWKVVPAPDSARMRFSLTDVYGKTWTAAVCVFRRVGRLVGWRRDQPDPPFGIKILAQLGTSSS